MSITAGDWASATDPFILALAHSFSSTLGDLSNERIIMYDTTGYLAAVVDDRDIQELFWSKDSDRELTWFVNAMEKLGSTGDPIAEIGKYQERFGSTFELFVPRDIFIDDTQDIRVYTKGKAAGAVLYSLFAYTAYTWVKKDPAQILFSWIAHHIDSVFTMKDFINQASFQAASDYYDLNPVDLSLYREVGLTVAQQIKKVISHTSDFLTINPSESDGKVQIHITPRQSELISRTTAIDLDSKSVKDYVVRPTDRYTMDRIDVNYGGVFFIKSGGIPDSPEDYNVSANIDVPGINRTKLSQNVGSATAGRSKTIDAPYHGTRGAIYNHLDIGQWIHDQEEIEVDFADWSHLNFNAGDIVPVTGGKAGHAGELFLVTEKVVDYDTMLASVRLLRIYAAVGKRPRLADNDNLLLSFAPNSLGDYFDYFASFPREVALDNNPRNIDRLWDLSNNYAHVTQMQRGAPPAGPLRVAPEVRGRWPGVLNDGTEGADMPYVLNDFVSNDSGAASDVTAYFVINPEAAGIGNSQVLFEQEGPTDDIAFTNGRAGIIQFYSGGTWFGTKAVISGWQILVFVLTGTGWKIRRNGVDLETGTGYTQTRFISTANPGYYQSLLVGATGDVRHFDGEFMEFNLFNAGHDTATVDDIEAYLADKYDITI